MTRCELIVETFPSRFAARVRDRESQVLLDGLNAFNASHTGDDSVELLGIFLRTDDGKVVGGLLGEISWEWLYVSVLWVADAHRREGYGSQILQAGEEEARKRGCHSVHLESLSFGATQFYERRGYEIFAQLDHYPGEHSRLFLKKQLVPL
jgi:GNAT superfamily N-acetyltransferase